MANGETLRKIVLDDHMPVSSAIYRWLDTNQIFKEQYTQARIKQADYYAEMIVDEAFNSHDAAIGRLRMDALKWAASKIAPKKYGDKVEVEQTGGTALTVSFALPSRSGKPEAIELESGKLPPP
jgi:ribosomal protein S7